MMWILIGAMLFFIAACHLLFVFPTWWVKIVRVDTPLGLNKTILQLSDFHVEKIRISPKRLKKFIMKEKIDYIFLTGDYLDEAWALPKFAAYLDILKESSIPVKEFSKIRRTNSTTEKSDSETMNNTKQQTNNNDLNDIFYIKLLLLLFPLSFICQCNHEITIS